jgi:hypothetical protein
MFATAGSVAAILVLAQVGGGENDTISSQTGVRQGRDPTRLQAVPTRTGKERLGRKSSDEQRIDNCNVPVELRGPKPRPDDCASDVNAHSER